MNSALAHCPYTEGPPIPTFSRPGEGISGPINSFFIDRSRFAVTLSPQDQDLPACTSPRSRLRNEFQYGFSGRPDDEGMPVVKLSIGGAPYLRCPVI
jgi:hypothetical protein